MTEQEANREIALKVNEAYAALAAAQKLADEFGLDFSFSPAYGMGGTYVGHKTSEDEDWESSDEEGWVSSSANC